MPQAHRKWKLPDPTAQQGPSLLKREIAQLKKSTAKQLCLLGAFVVLVALVVYLWSFVMEPQIDQSIAQIEEAHTCPHCGHVFQITVAEATRMRRAHGNIVCPACGKLGAEKNDAQPFTEVLPPSPPDDTGQDASNDDGSRAQRVTGGMRKKDG